MLKVDNIDVAYGDVQVLFDVSLDIQAWRTGGGYRREWRGKNDAPDAPSPGS